MVAASKDEQIRVGQIKPSDAPPISYITTNIFKVLPVKPTIHVESELLRDITHRVDCGWGKP